MSKFIEVIDINGNPITINTELVTDIRPNGETLCNVRLSGVLDITIKSPYHFVVADIASIKVSPFVNKQINTDLNKDDLGIY